MTQPFVGPPTVADGGCAFSADIDQPPCGSPPDVHLAVRSDAWGLVALSSCDRHAVVARASGDVISEHPHTPGCETDSTCWPPSIDDDALEGEL